MPESPYLTRRHVLASSAAIGMSVGAATMPALAHDVGDLHGPYLDLRTPRGNVLATARLHGDLDTSKTRIGYFEGHLMAAPPDQKITPLLGVEGFAIARLEPMEDGKGYYRFNREVAFYKNLRTGEFLDQWDNPFTGETVKVVHIANDPYNWTIAETFDVPGMDPLPFILPWDSDGEYAYLNQDVHTYHHSPLQPDEWPRESPGKYMQVSELFEFRIPLEDLQNPDLTAVDAHGSWIRISPWQPWMLMDQAPGWNMFKTRLRTFRRVEDLPATLLNFVEKNYPLYLSPPDTWDPERLSSFDRYAIEQQPAPLAEF